MPMRCSGSAAKLGFMYSALAAGSILGNFLYLAIEARVPRGVIQIGGFGLRALAFSVMLFMPDWWVIALALFIGAVALEPVNPMMMSILQEQVPPGMRARIYGVGSALFVVTSPIGIVAYGYLISWLGHGTDAGDLRRAQSGAAGHHALRSGLAAHPQAAARDRAGIRQDDASAPSSSEKRCGRSAPSLHENPPRS